MSKVVKAATEYLNSGLSVIPLRLNDKAPAVPTWTNLQSKRFALEEIERYFFSCFIGVIGGKISGGLEIIDFDNHDGEVENRFRLFKDDFERLGLPYEKTKSGGYHVFFKSDCYEGNLKLAQRYLLDGKVDTVIETRGEGGYVACSPSDGYFMLQGEISKIPKITEEEREDILSKCRSLNEVSNLTEHAYKERSGLADADSPVNRYNSDPVSITEIASLLEHAGWKVNGHACTRPGKQKGISAMLGSKFTQEGHPVFRVFSSNAYPFNGGESYSLFYTFAILAYDGNMTNAVKELAARYGMEYNKKVIKPKVLEVIQSKAKKKEKEKVSPDGGIDSGSFDKSSKMTRMIEEINERYEIRMDVIRNVAEYRPIGTIDWYDLNSKDMYTQLQCAGIQCKQDDLVAFLSSKYVYQYNAIQDYFENIHSWDGIDYFYDLTKYIKVDNPQFFAKMLEKQFVRAIKCALEEDFYNRIAFVIQSEKEEIGKSRFIKWLNPFGNKYYTDEPIEKNKDTRFSVTENFIFNLEELDDIKSMGSESIKALFAKRSVKDRLPYAATKIERKRICTFFGSTNHTRFLADSANTRWLVFHVDGIDYDGLDKNINVDDLWAMAYRLYLEEDYEWDLTDDEKAIRATGNESYIEGNLTQDFIMYNFDYDVECKVSLSHFAIMILENCGRLKMDMSADSLEKILLNLGFRYVELTMMGRKTKLFNVKRRIPEN